MYEWVYFHSGNHIKIIAGCVSQVAQQTLLGLDYLATPLKVP